MIDDFIQFDLTTQILLVIGVVILGFNFVSLGWLIFTAF